MKGKMNIHKLTASIAAVLLSASLFSCSSDDFFGKPESGSTNGISFGVSTENSAATRANKTDDGLTVARYTLRSDNSADTLCVRAVVTDGIGNNANKPATRAAMQTSMYNDFKVVAAVKENGTIGTQLFMNETATKTNTNWVPAHTYYWPGSNRQLRFLAWAPTDAFQAVPNTPNETTLQYTTPTEAKNQRDLVAAATDFIDSPANDGTCTPVSLNFKHLCTAVIIKTGEQMTAGTIESVSLKGVKNSGTYDMVKSEWTLNNSTADFTISPNKETTGATPNGTDLNAGESTFMLLPQTLGADSKLEVVFHDNISGNDRTLSASLNGAWPMGKTVTYRLSITPEYELKFTSTPEKVDAHYDIIPIKVNTKYVKGNWTIKSNQPWVTIKSALTTYEQSGYWLKATGDYAAYCKSEDVPVERQQTLDKTGNGETETTLYLFVEENNSTTDRTVTLTLSINGVDFATADIVQKCPNWKGDIGWEVLEDTETFPFGFKWDRKVTYQKKGFGFLSGPIEEWWMKQNFKKQPKGFWEWVKSIFAPETVPYVTVNYSNGTVTFTVDYSKMDEISAISTDDGLENTWNLYSHVGGTSFEGEKFIAGRGYTVTSQSGSNEIPKVFAALYAIKLNAFDVHKGGEGNKITYAITPEKKDINWYLPARNQFSGAVGLNGKHWSSTGIQDNSNAYTWDASPQSTPRMELHKVRAVRKK